MENQRLKEKMTGYVGQLIALEQEAGDAITVANLKRELPHIRQGLVRVMLIGQTSCGKSTLINAMMEKIIVPENRAVSSPIPVWIGYHESDEAEILIYNKQGEPENGEGDTQGDEVAGFIRNFCYRIDDRDSAEGTARERFDRVDYGSILLRARLLEGDVTVIDTPGISASTVDNAKTIKALEDGVDFVVFLTRNNQLNADEVDFLHRYVIGDAEGHVVSHPVPARNLFFVNNPHGAMTPMEHVFLDTQPVHGGKACGVRPFLRSIGSEKNGIARLSEEETEQIVKENVIFLNARKARVGRLGAYDYEKYAPAGCSEEELGEMRKLARFEEKYAARQEDRAKLTKDSNIEALEEAVGKAAAAAKAEVVSRRICEWKDMLLAVRQAADEKVAAASMDVSVIRDRKRSLEEIKDKDDAITKKISDKFIDLQDEYLEAFRRFMQQYKDMIRSECFGAAGRMPDDFEANIVTFGHMTDQQKVDYVEPFIARYTDICIATCNSTVKKLLEETGGSKNGGKAPFDVLEEIREYIEDQSKNLKLEVRTLKTQGAEGLGVAFPTDLNIEKIYEEFRKALIDAIYSAIANQFNQRRNEILATIHPLIQKVHFSIWQRIFHRKNAQQCWDEIREQICQKVVEGFFEKAVVLADHQAEIRKAFGIVASEVQKTHHEIFAAVNQALFVLEKEKNAGERAGKEAAAESRRITNACREIEDALDHELMQLR